MATQYPIRGDAFVVATKYNDKDFFQLKFSMYVEEMRMGNDCVMLGIA